MKWISVEDRMPKDYQRVLATDGKGCDFLHLSNEYGFMEQPTGVKFWCPDNIHCSPKVNIKKITHWAEVELPAKKVYCNKCKHWKPIKKCCSIQRPNINYDCIDFEDKEK